MIMMTFLPPISRCVFLNEGAGRLRHGAADLRRARERHDPDLVAHEQRVAHFGAGAGDEIDDARRDARPPAES